MHHAIKVRNVNGALSAGMLLLGSRVKAAEQPSRNGPVKRAHGPVLFETTHPMERVLFSPLRKANPFFHLMESLWMLGGRNDLPWLTQFNKQMGSYSDDGGKTQPAAYGFRWREHFGYDQLDLVVDHLTKFPESRRAVIAMWDATMSDLAKASKGSKDVPCNTQIYLQLETLPEGTQLNMTITCRSNDALWGAHGANAVHFSILLEYLAARLSASLGHSIHVGRMYQLANDYHYYTDILKAAPEALAMDASDNDLYASGEVAPMALFKDRPGAQAVGRFEYDISTFMDYADPVRNPVRTPARGGSNGRRELDAPEFKTTWFNTVALPMLKSWDAWKQKDLENAKRHAFKVAAEDWRKAAVDWMDRQDRS